MILLANVLASQEIAAFDALEAPFRFEASQLTVPSSGASIAARLQRFLQPIQLRSLPDAWGSMSNSTGAGETLLPSPGTHHPSP